MSSNPFEKLHIKRDEEEDDDGQGEFQQVKSKDKNVPFGIEQKKKKQRPKEKVEDEGDEGFEEVPSKYKKKNPERNDLEEEVKGDEHKKRKGINYNTAEERDYRTKDKPRRGRQFDKHSGTGRGKEIAKGGAGGKGTWGENPKTIARNFENNNDDDYYFENALNPEKKKERQPKRPKREDKKEEKKEGEEGEEKEGEEKKEEKEEKKNKREKKFEPKPLSEEEKVKIPEGAMSLDEYLKSKEKPKEEEQKEIKRIQDGNPLVKREEKKEEIYGTSELGKKKGKKKKQKEINKEELDLNAKIGANLAISGTDERERRPRKKDWKKGNKKEEKEKFVFNEKDFPEL